MALSPPPGAVSENSCLVHLADHGMTQELYVEADRMPPCREASRRRATCLEERCAAR